MTLNLDIGDPWPFRSVRGLTGRPIAPQWFALITAPQQEAKTATRLERAGVEVQYPTQARVRHIRGKRHDYEVPMVSRIIYAQFRYAPQWDVMRDRRIIAGVFTRGDEPIALNGDDVNRMMGLPTEAERIRAAEIAEKMPRAGERAKITDGPFSGFCVDVTRVEAGRVWYSMLTGVKGQAALGMVERIKP